MKTTTIILLFLVTYFNVKAQTTKKVQDFVLNSATKHWERQGLPYPRPDTLTTIYGYKWKRERIIAVQDYKKVNGVWVKQGKEYPTPDTLILIHAFVR